MPTTYLLTNLLRSHFLLLALAPLKVDKFAELVASQPGFTHAKVETNTLTLNVNVSDEEEATIDVVIDALDPAIDSSSMTPTDWTRISQVSDSCVLWSCHGVNEIQRRVFTFSLL